MKRGENAIEAILPGFHQRLGAAGGTTVWVGLDMIVHEAGGLALDWAGLARDYVPAGRILVSLSGGPGAPDARPAKCAATRRDFDPRWVSIRPLGKTHVYPS